MALADIEIFGAGIFGLSIAYSCARRGCKVRVVEKRQIGAGASGGILGALAPHAPHNWNAKKQFQFDSLIMASDWWAEVTEIGGIDPVYERMGRFQPIANAHALALAKQRQAAARKNWDKKAEWQIIEADGDWMPQSMTGHAIFDNLSASIRPVPALQGLSAAIRSLGGEICEGQTEGEGADILIHATGHEGLRRLRSTLGADIWQGEKGTAALLQCPHTGPQQIFAEGIHMVPHSDQTLAIGSTSERLHSPANNQALDIDDLIDRAKEIVPAIKAAKRLHCWTGIRPRTSRRLPLLGPFPKRPGHFIANGGYKIGFGLAPLVGEVLADLVQTGHCRIPHEFLPSSTIDRMVTD